jgi:hypothetical protein
LSKPSELQPMPWATPYRWAHPRHDRQFEPREEVMEMRKLMFALAIAAGLAAPMAVPAHATFCTTQCMGNMCTTICT